MADLTDRETLTSRVADAIAEQDRLVPKRDRETHENMAEAAILVFERLLLEAGADALRLVARLRGVIGADG